MSFHFAITRAARTKLRKLPFLPRFAITVDIAGRQLTYRQSPMLESLLNLRDRGLSLHSLRRLAKDELSELSLPELKAPIIRAVKATKAKVQPIKKAGTKAALKKN